MVFWGCLSMVLLTPVGVLLRGAALMQMWAWFVVPLGFAPISLPWALGLAILAYMLVGRSAPATPQSGDSREIMLKASVTYAMDVVGTPLLALLFGWFWHGWM